MSIAGAEAVVVVAATSSASPCDVAASRQRHSYRVSFKTRDLPQCLAGRHPVAAIGKAGMITPDFVKPGATVMMSA